MESIQLLQAADLHWDAMTNVLRVQVATSRGSLFVTIPMSTVAFEFRRAAQEESQATVGVVDILGDVEVLGYPLDTVGGLFGSIKKLGRKAFRAVKKTVKRVRTVAHSVAKKAVSGSKWALRQGRAALNSKWTRYGLMAASVACPAVGGPAMAAYFAAQQADRVLRAGGAAARTVSSSVRRLNSGKPTVFRSLSLAALQSVGG